jgi:hypothetical protein
MAQYRPITVATRKRLTLGEARPQLVEVAPGGAGGRVAAVQEEVEAHAGKPGPLGQLAERVQVRVHGVHPPRAEEPHQVKRAPSLRDPGDEAGEGLVLEESPRLDGFGDALDRLRHHPPGAQVEVPHLGVAHLAVGEADGATAGAQRRPRMVAALPEGVPGGGVRHRDGVVVGGLAQAPAVEDHQRDARASGGAIGSAHRELTG